MNKRRVVVTGIGIVCPIGNDINDFQSNLFDGKNGIDFITNFDTEDHKVKIAGEVKNFDPLKYIEKKELRRLDKYSVFGISAAHQALNDAGISKENIDAFRFGCIVGSGIGGLETIENNVIKLIEKGPHRVSPMYIPAAISNMAAGNIAIIAGAKAMCSSVATACAAATNAIGDSLKVIERGDADIMITGGAEAAITPSGIAGFANLSALNTKNDPNRGSIPFDKERSGFVMGEGSGILIIEELEHAKNRGANIYAELIGYGATCDASHITAPSGEGGKRAMENAVKDAGIKITDVDYINAHGTSTPLNDKFEIYAIKEAFGEHSKKLLVSSTKSMTGHLLGASGGVEAIATILALKEGIVPPTINYQIADEECDLDIVPNKARVADIKYAISNSLGFGGHNASIIFKRWDENVE